jgi:hypothetical protein
MERKTSVSVERLETWAVLSGLTYSLTTNQAVYQVGQPVQMSFTETNTSGAPIQVGWGPAVWTVRQNGNVVFWGGVAYLSIVLVTLQPGQSLTATETWNGEPEGTSSAHLTGEFSAGTSNAPAGMSATFQIESSPINVTVTTDRSSYEAGHHVPITVTLTNVSSHAITLRPKSKIDGITILEGSTVVWRSRSIGAADKFRTLHAGQIVRLSFLWHGKANQRGVTEFTSGLYTIQAVVGGYAGAGAVQIE